MADVGIPATLKLMDLTKSVVVLAGVQLLTGCGPTPQDRASEARAILAERFGQAVEIRSLVASGAGGTVCGYAERPGAGRFPELIPFAISGKALVIHSEDVERFRQVEHGCGPGWVGPRDQAGIS